MPKHVIYDNVIYYDDGEVDKEKETKKQEKNTQKHVIYHDDVEDYVEGAIADISGFDLEAYKASLPEGVHMWVDHHPTTIDNGFAPLPLFKDIMKQKKPMTYIEEHQIDLDKLLPRLSSRWPSTKDEEYRRRGEKVNSASDLHKLLSPSVIQDAPIQSCRSKLGVGPTIYPQRSGQLECDIYMKTGQCKFGKRCKFHHPIDRTAPSSGDEYSELYYRTYGRRGRTPAATCTGGDREITPTGWEDGEDNDVDVWCAPAYEDVGSSSGAREITPTGWEDDDDDDVDVRRTSVYGDVGSSSGAREITPTGWEDDDVDVWRVPAYGDVGDDGNGGFVDSIFGYPPQHGYGSRPYGYGRNYET